MKSQLLPLLVSLLLLLFSQGLSAQNLIFTASNEAGSPGDTVTIAIAADNFTGISGYQGTIRFDTAAVEFISLGSPTAGISNIFGSPGQGLIPLDAATFTWINFSGGTTTLPNGSALMEISFEIKANAAPGSYPVSLDSSITTMAFSNGTTLFPIAVNHGSVTVNNCTPTEDPGFLFPATVCQNGFNPQAILTGDLGGTFSVDQGASINPVTGVLDLSTTVGGTSYTVTYTLGTTCPVDSSKTVQVIASDDASFTFVDTVCMSGFNPQAVILGDLGGSFSVNPFAFINPTTGVLDLSTTSPNTSYTVTYQTAGACPAISSEMVFVADSGDASFLYPTALCPGSPNPTAIITGDTGGLFSVSPAANINPVTGELDLSTTMIGVTYTIFYDLNNFCQDFSQQTVMIADLVAPDSVALPTLIGECSVPVPVPTTTDDCAGLISGTTGDPLSYVNQGTYLLIWTFDDGNGNQTTLPQTVIVNDSTPPTVVCQNLTVQLDANGLATITAAQIDNGSIDSCGLMSLFVSQDTFTSADLGQNMVSLIATDVNGNQDSCMAMVTVIGANAPVAVCQDVTLYLDSLGSAYLSPAALDSGSTVSFGSPQLSVGQDSFDCTTLGLNLVYLSVSDSLGNVDSCLAMVTVLDTIAPVVICQALSLMLDSTGFIVIDPTMIDGGSSDNCGIQSMSLSQDTFTVADIGMQTLTLTVVDESGNSSTCTTMVTVEGTTAIEGPNIPGLLLQAYPNPVQETLALEWTSPWFGEVSINVLNAWGQVVHRETRTKQADLLEVNLGLGKLAAGVYLVQVNQNGQTQYTKVLKQ